MGERRQQFDGERERGLQSKIHTILLGLILTSDELSLLGENDDGEKEA